MLKAISDSLVAARAPIYQQEADTLRAYGATVLQARYRLAQALLVVIPLAAIDSLAQRPEVIHIDPLHGGGPPGPCGSPSTTHATAAGLLRISRAPAASADLAGKLALLDTGVHTTHILLRPGPVPVPGGTAMFSPLDRLYQVCGEFCLEESTTQEDVEPDGHGTSSAAILSATAAMGPNQLGLTRARIDSYRVYDPPAGEGHSRINWGSAPLAIDHAVLDSAQYLIVAEMADGAGYGALTDQARHAFNMGAMVIAANGDKHGSDVDPIPQPAIAPTVLGVGQYCVFDQSFAHETTRGPTPDGRWKPELGGLTMIYTAAARPSDDKAMHGFAGTSGATPTVAAVALVLHNWLKGPGDAVNPGQVYAMLLMCGQSGRVDPEQGAGLIQIPSSGVLWWGPATIHGGDSLEIQIPQGNSKWSQLDAALWWPELDSSDGGGPSLSERAWVALRLDDPARGAFVRSDAHGVFQRASLHASSLRDGAWFLTLLGNSIPEGQTRTVFWAVRGQ
jgi:hypothetical protein